MTAKQDEVDLHDAQLKSMNVDYVRRQIVVDLDYYRDQVKDRDRVLGRLTFRNVVSFTSVADLVQMRDNFAAGNVTNWWRQVDGKTYLYLAGGCMIIESKSVKLETIKRK